MATPHRDKLMAAIANPKAINDVDVLSAAVDYYSDWVQQMEAVTSVGKQRVVEMVRLLNAYKDIIEVELIMKKGSDFLRRQKGQLKLDNSINEEFFSRLIHPDVIQGLGNTPFLTGPQTAFLSLSFHPRGVAHLQSKPEVVVKSKDQDFVLGTTIHYQFAPTDQFLPANTTKGSFVLAVLAAECKVNLDKTMYQEAAGTATRLKMGCPIAKYFILAEFLDMEPEDCRLADIDNVLLLRHAKRLPFDRRSSIEAVERQHKEYPIDSEIVWRFVEEIQAFVNAIWYDPAAALARGSFI